MYRQTQREYAGSAGYTAGGTDWKALEVQLTRTRLILQEILVHLQDVLRNLKMARAATSGFGPSARAADRQRTQATPPPHGFRARQTASGTSARPSASTAGQAGATQGDRFRARPRPGFETRTETGQTRTTAGTHAGPHAASGRSAGTHAGSNRSTFGERPRTEDPRFRATSRPGTETPGRERPRTDNTFRARTGQSTGASRDAHHQQQTGPQGTAGQSGSQQRQAGASASSSASGASQSSRSHARPSARPTASSDFTMDRERQRRAREAARKGGMNLKCAYDILCLDYPCSADEIKVAYRHMARLHHPDLGGDEEAMKDVNVAYELAMRFCAGPRRASAAWAV